MTTETKEVLSDVKAIKIYFELTGSDTLKEIKALSADERKELGEMCRAEINSK